jgi:hypothetical protein
MGLKPFVDSSREVSRILYTGNDVVQAEGREAVPMTNPAPIPTPHNLHERLELATKLYREFQNQCFWHSPRDLVITEELIPFVVKGLRTYGGGRGFKLAGKLEASGAPNEAS